MIIVTDGGGCDSERWRFLTVDSSLLGAEIMEAEIPIKA